MPICSRENGQNTKILEGRHFRMMQKCQRLLGAQSINIERASLKQKSCGEEGGEERHLLTLHVQTWRKMKFPTLTHVRM